MNTLLLYLERFAGTLLDLSTSLFTFIPFFSLNIGTFHFSLLELSTDSFSFLCLLFSLDSIIYQSCALYTSSGLQRCSFNRL